MATFTNKTRGARENAVTGGVLSQQDRLFLEERFLKAPALNPILVIDPDADNASALAAFVVANRDFEYVENGTATVALSTGGGIKLTTASTDGNDVIVKPHLDTNQTLWATADWSTDDQVAFTAIIETDSTIVDRTIIVGLKLTDVFTTADDADQAFFRYQDTVNGGRWQAIDSSGASGTETDTTTDTGITVAASTRYKLEIRIDAQRVPRYYINGVHVATGEALDANVDLIPLVGIQTDSGSSAKSMYFRYLSMSKEYNN